MSTTVLSASDVLQSIQQWDHWTEIQQGAEKEYGVTKEEFEKTLPEYQKFLALVAIGHRNMGMFSEAVDKLWHTHILNTQLYETFCNRFFGTFMHHAPNLSRNIVNEGICTPQCKTPQPPCNIKPRGEGATQPTFDYFRGAYQSAFGPIASLWDLHSTDAVALQV